MPSSIAFFDVDHTLLPGNSGFHATLRLIKKGLIKKHRLLQAFYYRAVGSVFDLDIRHIYHLATKDTIGLKVADIFEIGEECLREDIVPRLYPQALKIIQQHRQKGHYIVLMTSGPTMVAEPLAKFLKAHACYSVGSEITAGIITGRFPDIINYGAGKIHYAKLACDRFGVLMKNCYFYTDHHSDIPLLKEVGHPVAVNPDAQLFLTAKRRSWPVEKFRMK